MPKNLYQIIYCLIHTSFQSLCVCWSEKLYNVQKLSEGENRFQTERVWRIHQVQQSTATIELYLRRKIWMNPHNFSKVKIFQWSLNWKTVLAILH